MPFKPMTEDQLTARGDEYRATSSRRKRRVLGEISSHEDRLAVETFETVNDELRAHLVLLRHDRSGNGDLIYRSKIRLDAGRCDLLIEALSQARTALASTPRDNHNERNEQ